MIARGILTPVWLAFLCVAVAGAVSAQPSTPGGTPVPVTWLIFVDDLHLDFRNTGRIRDALMKLASALIQDGDRFAIASGGPSSLAVATVRGFQRPRSGGQPVFC